MFIIVMILNKKGHVFYTIYIFTDDKYDMLSPHLCLRQCLHITET